MKKLSIYLLATLIFFVNQAQDSTFFTLRFDAPHNSSGGDYIGATLDDLLRTHIVWRKTEDGFSELMYSLVDDLTVETYQITEFNNEELSIRFPVIQTDSNNNPHISFQVRRKSSAGTNTGNYAVYYLGDEDGNREFTLSQVSTNSEDPFDDSDSLFHAYVNAGPDLSIDENGEIWVGYLGSVSGGFFANYILAKKVGTAWERSFALNVAENADYNASTRPADMAFNGSSDYFAWVDINAFDGDPRYAYRSSDQWIEVVIENQKNQGNGSHKLTVDNSGVVHYTFYSVDKERFIHYTIENESYQLIDEYSLNASACCGSYTSTIDPVTGQFYFLSEAFGDDVVGWHNDGVTTEIREEFRGRPLGINTPLSVINGNISYITASTDSEEIYVTTNYNFLPEPRDGIILNLPMDGNLNDQSGLLRNAESIGEPELSENRLNMPTSAYFLDGEDDYIVIDEPITSDTSFTVSVWFKTTTITGGQIIGFGNRKTGASSSYGRKIYLNDAGQVIFGIWDSGAKIVQSEESYNDGEWHHAIGTHAVSKGRQLYVDGVLVGNDEENAEADIYNGYWRIGYDRMRNWPELPASEYFNGTVDDVLVFNTSLSSEEVISVFNFEKRDDDIVGCGNKPTGLEQVFPMDPPCLTSASFNWNFFYERPTDFFPIRSHTFFYKKLTDSNYDSVNIVTTPFDAPTLFGLEEGTDYQMKLRVNCSATDMSELSDSLTFSTPCSTPNISENSVMVESNSISLEWTKRSNLIFFDCDGRYGSRSFRIEYKLISSQEWTSVEYQDTSVSEIHKYTINDLEEGQPYDIRIATICNSGNSEFDSINVITETINDFPVVVNAIPDTTYLEGFVADTIHLDEVFEYSNYEELTFNVLPTGQGQPDLVGLEIKELDLIIKEKERNFGLIELIVNAIDPDEEIAEDQFTIRVEKINDSPVITPDQVFSVNEDVLLGTTVGQIEVFDQDGDDVSMIFIDGNISNAFGIRNFDGFIEVTNTSPIDFSFNPQFILTVEAFDGEETSTEVIVIEVIEVPVLSLNEKNRTQIDIHPNPTKDAFSLSSSMSFKAINLISLDGKQMKQFNYNESNSYNISDLNYGTYIVYGIIDGKKFDIGKVIKRGN